MIRRLMHLQASAAEAALSLNKRQHQGVFLLKFFLLMSRKYPSCCHRSPQKSVWTKISDLVTRSLLRQKSKIILYLLPELQIFLPALFWECVILQQNHHWCVFVPEGLWWWQRLQNLAEIMESENHGMVWVGRGWTAWGRVRKGRIWALTKLSQTLKIISVKVLWSWKLGL